jgi:CBS domain-containing protein
MEGRAFPFIYWHPKEGSVMVASDIMTRKVYTTCPTTSVQEVAQLLSQQRISGAPVLDGNGRIVGMITEADILSALNREGLRVADIMSRELIVVEEKTPVGDIAKLLAERKIKRVPVVRHGKLVGIVSRADIVHAVAEGHVILRHW